VASKLLFDLLHLGRVQQDQITQMFESFDFDLGELHGHPILVTAENSSQHFDAAGIPIFAQK
jgi:hypothetical protein